MTTSAPIVSRRRRDQLLPPKSLRSKAVSRLRLHAHLGWEPDGFRELAPILAGIDGWRFPEDLALLYLLARDVGGPGLTLEIGSYKGLATTALAHGVRAGGHEPVHTVDPHTGDRQALEEAGSSSVSSEQALRETIARASLSEHVVAYTMTSDELAVSWDGSAIRVLFVDGWHSYDAVASDLRNWVPRLTAGGIVLVDDYANYPDVRAALDDADELLPPERVRAGRMLLAFHRALPRSVDRYLRIPWG